MDLRSAVSDPAPSDLLAIHAAIFRAAGVAPGPHASEDLNATHFPSDLLSLKLGPLLRIILFAGSIREDDRLRPKQKSFAATNLVAATMIDRAAVSLLRDWPHPFHDALRRMLPPDADDPGALSFSRIFGNFYRHLFCVLSASESAFMREEFEQFVVTDWKGLIRGTHRHFSETVRARSQWVCANEVEKTAQTSSRRVMDLVRTHQIKGAFLNAPNRTECWVRRESLTQWIANRDAELARYMLRPEVERTLGLKNITVTAVADAGAIRYVRGPIKDFPSGYAYFLREDVMKIQQAFERYAVPTQEYVKPGIFIALRHAIKNFLGRGPGLAAVIQAVVEGSLTPVGYLKPDAAKHCSFRWNSKHGCAARPRRVPHVGFCNVPWHKLRFQPLIVARLAMNSDNRWAFPFAFNIPVAGYCGSLHVCVPVVSRDSRSLRR